MKSILVVDDDAALREVLSELLAEAGYQVTLAHDGLEAVEKLKSSTFDLILSDVNMPRLDGFALCRKVRQGDPHIPIILLTTREGDIDEALGLDLGADDFMSKPFGTRVLLARIAALLRRTDSHRGGQTTPKKMVGDVSIDQERLEVTFQEHEITLTLSEFYLLQALTERPGIVFSRDQILDKMRGDSVMVDHRIVDTYVRRLRRKFETIDPSFACIETVVGVGYRWKKT